MIDLTNSLKGKFLALKKCTVQKLLALRVILQQLLLVLLFSGLLSIAFLDAERFYLTWFAFVPLLFAIDKATLLRTYLLGVFAGLTLFISGTYWIADFINIAKGSSENANLWLAFVYWLYCAQLIALLLLLLNWLRKHTRINDLFLFPVVVVTFTSAYPMLFPMRLGESQINFYSALQATEFFGVHSLDAIIALSNIMFFRVLFVFFSNNAKSHSQSKWAWSIALLLITLWFSYGLASYNKWEKAIASWETLKVGLVQPNEVPKVGHRKPYAGYSLSYPPEIEMTERLTSIGAEIVIWPEAYPKNYLDNSKVRAAYQKNVGRLDLTLIFQDLHTIVNPISGESLSRYNSAIMLNNNGEQVGLYNKIKRIPFGEYIPILNEGSLLSNIIEKFLGKFLNKYSAGESHQLFKHAKLNIIPLICYETTFPNFVARAVSETVNQSEPSKGTLLLGLSNDGWFGSTHQPYQHVMASVLRSVENRLPLIHVANNGPSIVVAPHGRVIFTTDFQKAGGYIVDVPHSNMAQGSFYSRHPSLFTNLIYAVLFFMLLRGVFIRLRN
jgi:apolipoprotein N-acyltransferase